MTTQVNPILSEAEQIFKDLIFTPMVKLGEKWIETQAPVLALPVIRELDEAVVQFITDQIFNSLVQFIDVSAIKLINDAHQSAYETASEKLLIVAKEKGVNSPEYQEAHSVEVQAFIKFVSLSD